MFKAPRLNICTRAKRWKNSLPAQCPAPQKTEATAAVKKFKRNGYVQLFLY